jgi:hypothetical protein
MRTVLTSAACALIAFLGVGEAPAQQAQAGRVQMNATQIVNNAQLAFYYPGDDMKARVTMELVARSGGKRTRVMTMLRRDREEAGEQKYFVYFHEPGDVRGMTFMTWKYPDRDDDRWIFVPAVDLVRRIAADDKYSSFVGSDFSYEDVSGRDVGEDEHTLVGQEQLGGRPCYVVQSVPKGPGAWTRRISWIDRESFLPLKEEYYDAQDELFRVFTADEIDDVVAGGGGGRTGYPTVTRRTMENVKTGHRTTVTYDSISYDLGLVDEDFSERRMRRPPRSWIR